MVFLGLRTQKEEAHPAYSCGGESQGYRSLQLQLDRMSFLLQPLLEMITPPPCPLPKKAVCCEHWDPISLEFFFPVLQLCKITGDLTEALGNNFSSFSSFSFTRSVI